MKTKTIDRQMVQLTNKPFEEMALTELYAESMVRRWHKTQMNYHIKRLKKRKWWLEQNEPIPTVEEIKRQYENGEMTEKQYRTAFARRSRAINYRMRVDDYMRYADLLVYSEAATLAYINELITEKQSAEKMGEGMKGKTAYDPRKRESPSNQRKWSTRVEYGELPKLRKQRKRWQAYKAKDDSFVRTMKQITPVEQWDASKLQIIAKDKGYFTDIAVTAAVSDALNISIGTTKKLLSNGKFTWGQCIVIGSLFEMTPKEFCDCFLCGYFKEVADGVFHAYVEDPTALLDAPYRARIKEEVTDNE